MRAGKTERVEGETREKMGLGEETELCMVCEGRRVDWGDLEKVDEGRVVEVGLMIKGGGKKEKGTKNPWDSSGSEAEKGETDKSGKKAWERRLAGRCWRMC